MPVPVALTEAENDGERWGAWLINMIAICIRKQIANWINWFASGSRHSLLYWHDMASDRSWSIGVWSIAPWGRSRSVLHWSEIREKVDEAGKVSGQCLSINGLKCICIQKSCQDSTCQPVVVVFGLKLSEGLTAWECNTVFLFRGVLLKTIKLHHRTLMLMSNYTWRCCSWKRARNYWFKLPRANSLQLQRRIVCIGRYWGGWPLDWSHSPLTI